ncbi:Uncharacterised protein [Vibrio cholerae]|nr:Uncharacterised protein [Vibrio cholerae]
MFNNLCTFCFTHFLYDHLFRSLRGNTVKGY